MPFITRIEIEVDVDGTHDDRTNRVLAAIRQVGGRGIRVRSVRTREVAKRRDTEEEGQG
jgi:hypothetical protein